MPLHRGTPVVEPPKWTRGLTPHVEYTGRPLFPPPAPQLSKAGKNKRRGADVRLRRALIDGWCDPERAQRDLLAAGTAYADLRDAQGLANAFVAHAQTRLAKSHLAEWDAQLSLPASNMAREEYAHAHVLYSSLLETSPAHYSSARQKAVHKAAIGQVMRPVPLTLSAEDARTADMGIGL